MNLTSLGKIAKQLLGTEQKVVRTAAQQAKKAPKFTNTGNIYYYGDSAKIAIENNQGYTQTYANIKGFINSKEADQFIKSASKQNAEIISDVIGFPNMSWTPYRIITKKLPSGTFVTETFNEKGKMVGKEVIAKNSQSVTRTKNTPYGKEITFHHVRGNKNIASLQDGKNIVSWQPPYSVTDDFLGALNRQLSTERGITEEVNKGKVLYDAQKTVWEAEKSMEKAKRNY